MKKKAQIVKVDVGGRPPIVIDDKTWMQIDNSMKAGCSGASIARQHKIHPETLYAKVVERFSEAYGLTTFSDILNAKKEDGKDALRRRQMDTAMTDVPGSIAMQIWLGKQLLGQREQIEQTITVPQVSVHTLDESEQLEISTALTALEQHESNESLSEEPDSHNGK